GKDGASARHRRLPKNVTGCSTTTTHLNRDAPVQDRVPLENVERIQRRRVDVIDLAENGGRSTLEQCRVRAKVDECVSGHGAAASDERRRLQAPVVRLAREERPIYKEVHGLVQGNVQHAAEKGKSE